MKRPQHGQQKKRTEKRVSQRQREEGCWNDFILFQIIEKLIQNVWIQY